MSIIKSVPKETIKLHKICKSMGVRVHAGRTEYGPGVYLHSDEICYDNTDLEYNATHILLHEMCHATGAKHRLCRPGFTYSSVINRKLEEIIAIYSSIQLTKDLGLTLCPETEANTMSYIDSHYQVNEEDYDIEFIMNRVGEAVNYIARYWSFKQEAAA